MWGGGEEERLLFKCSVDNSQRPRAVPEQLLSKQKPRTNSQGRWGDNFRRGSSGIAKLLRKSHKKVLLIPYDR